MKKTLFAILALAAIVACNKADVIDSNPGEAILFGNAFVDNATKAATDPSYNSTNLTAFNVYGAVEGVNIFAGAKVSKGEAAYGVAWTVSDAPTQYWIAGANYIFDAVVDATSVVKDDATGLPTTLKYDAAGQKDMLHQRVTTVGKPTENNGLVAFTFTHLLSKVKFTVTNNTDANATQYQYTVTGITLTNANLTGNYAYANDAWGWTNHAKGPYSIADMTIASDSKVECAKEVLLVPSVDANDKVGISFNVNVQMKKGSDWVTVKTYEKSYNNVMALDANKAYNFSLTVGLDDDIEFTAMPVKSWTTVGDTTLDY